VVGKDRVPEYDDSQNLPYFNATLNEVLRLRPAVPEALLHRVTEDFSVAGYKIKKETFIVPNIYNICHNPNYWEDPEAFRPERFLNWDSKNLAFSPFGYGPRICAGQRIAKVDMFYLLTHMLQKFEFYSDDKNFDIPGWRHLTVLIPNNYYFKLKRRM